MKITDKALMKKLKWCLLIFIMSISPCSWAHMNKSKEWDPESDRYKEQERYEKTCARNAVRLKNCQANLKKALAGCTRVQDEIKCGDEIFKKLAPTIETDKKI